MKFKIIADSKILALLPVFLLSACAGMQGPSPAGKSLVQTDKVDIKPLTEKPDVRGKDAYHLLVAELAISRGQTELAVEHYLQLAKSQQNPAIAERAVKVAVYGENLEAAIEAAERWVELDPQRTEAQQVIAAIYIRQNRVEDAFSYLDTVIRKTDISDKQLFALPACDAVRTG